MIKHKRLLGFIVAAAAGIGLATSLTASVQADCSTSYGTKVWNTVGNGQEVECLYVSSGGSLIASGAVSFAGASGSVRHTSGTSSSNISGGTGWASNKGTRGAIKCLYNGGSYEVPATDNTTGANGTIKYCMYRNGAYDMVEKAWCQPYHQYCLFP